MFVPVWIDVVVAFVYAKTRKLDFGKRGFGENGFRESFYS